MLLNRVYEDFLKHTDLTDSAFKAVFKRISEVLEKVNKVKWKRLVYTYNKVFDIDFETYNVAPIYIIDVLKNVFFEMYAFPEDSQTQVFIEYEGTEYEIVCQGNIRIIPDEVKFIKDLNIFLFYFLDKGVSNVFLEFDRIFKFMDTFKTPPHDVYSSLKKFFDKDVSDILSYEEGASPTDELMKESFTIDSLEQRRSEILNRISSIQKERDVLNTQSIDIKKGINSRSRLLSEKESYTNDFNALKDIHENNSERVEELTDLIKSINSEVEGIIDTEKETGEDYSRDKEMLLDKRNIFEAELMNVQQNLTRTTEEVKTIQEYLTEIGNKIVEIENYTEDDLSIIDTKLINLNQEQEELYSELLQTEHDIKTKKLGVERKAESTVNSSALASTVLQDIEKKDIVEHIKKPMQPLSIVTVHNYIKYYFAYFVDMLYEDLMQENIGDDAVPSEWVRAVACRQVLEAYFGIELPVMFSAITYNSATSLHFITVNRG